MGSSSVLRPVNRRTTSVAASQGASAADAPTEETCKLPAQNGGAKGIRTPDPHTASVVRYQLRHSPKMCLSKLHHGLPAIKVADQTASSNAGRACFVPVSGANTQTTAAASMMMPLTVKPQAKLKCSAI